MQEDKKIDVLMAQLNERYGALHKMRDRSTNFTLWILGFGLGLAWLLISECTLSTTQACAVVFFLVVVGFFSVVFLRAMHRGFNNNRDIVIRIETLLKLYEEDFYGSGESILPKEFSRNKFHWGGHFPTLYVLLGVVFFCLIILTFVNPRKHIITAGYQQPTKDVQKQFEQK